jgi:hypothetical protein
MLVKGSRTARGLMDFESARRTSRPERNGFCFHLQPSLEALRCLLLSINVRRPMRCGRRRTEGRLAANPASRNRRGKRRSRAARDPRLCSPTSASQDLGCMSDCKYNAGNEFPRQESNLVFDRRRVACDPAHSEDFLFSLSLVGQAASVPVK